MAHVKAAPEKAYEEPRIDSGAALSDPAALSGGPGRTGNLVMPILQKTNWDHGTPKARFRKNDLRLRQPKGFPIILLKVTLERDFEVYEELEKVGEVEDGIEVGEEDDEEEAEDTADEEVEGSMYDSADDNANASDDAEKLPTTRLVTEKPAALVDSRGRTRAATNRRKAQEASEPSMQTSV